MKKENRIKKRKEFNYIFRNGQVINSKYVNLLTTSSKLKKFKVGISVSKKVGKAVVRNKVKRRIKEAVNKQINLLQTKTNYIFVAKVGSSEASFNQIFDCVKYCLTKLNSSIKNNEKNS